MPTPMVRKIKLLFLDDNVMMHRMFKALLGYYTAEKYWIEFDVDDFYSSEEFYKKRAKRYDVAIVDYNIGPALHDTGDNVLRNLNGSCPLKYILTGMSTEIIKTDGITEWCIENDVVLLYKQRYEELLLTMIRELDRCIEVLSYRDGMFYHR